MVALTGGSSKQSSLVKRLAVVLPARLRRKPDRITPQRPRQEQRRLTHEQVVRLVGEYQAGDDMKVLAERWDLHRTTVAAQLRRAGVELRRQGIPTDGLKDAIRLYGEGWSCVRIGERYGCDAETVRQALKRADLRLRAPWERG